MLLGIAAGLIFIIAAFVGYNGELDDTGVVYIAVGICLIGCFIPLYNSDSRKRGCERKTKEG